MKANSLKKKAGITAVSAAMGAGLLIAANTNSVMAEELPAAAPGTEGAVESAAVEGSSMLPQTKAEATENLVAPNLNLL